MFESRLSKTGMGPKTNTFSELSNENDLEEKVMHNTHLNGLNLKSENKSNIDIERKLSNISSKRITWADNNNLNRKDLLCNTNFTKDLYYQKDIKPVLNHKKGKPIKPILKKRPNSADPSSTKFKIYNLNNVTASTNLNNSNINNHNSYGANSNYNSNINNYGGNNSFINNENKSNQDNNLAEINSNNSIVNNFMNSKNYGGNNDPKRPLGQNNNYANLNQNNNNSNISLINNSNIGNKENSNFNSRLSGNNMENSNLNNFSRPNYFNNNSNYTNNSNNNPQPRSYSLDQKNESNNRASSAPNSNYPSNNMQGEITKIIITPNIHSIYNHNINNYYIQSSNDINFDRLRENNITPPNNVGVSNLNFDPNPYKINERPNSVTKKDSNSVANSNKSKYLPRVKF